MPASNADQIEYWNGQNGAKWVRIQARMDRALAPFSDRAIAAALVQAGERVLDIGCGCGSTTIQLGRQVGPEGLVIGVDVSRPMLEVARAAGEDPWVRFVEGDAAAHDFGSERFDLAFSRFGVMFFADADAAFAHIGRAIRPGGRIAFACWRNLSENPWMLQPVLVAKQFVELPPRPGPEEPGPFSFSEPERIRRILSAGGFADIAVEPYDHPMYMGADIDEAVRMAMEVGPVGTAAANLDDAARQALMTAMAEPLRAFEGPDGFAAAGAIWCVTARKA